MLMLEVEELLDELTVWCDEAEHPARTSDGFCEICGARGHGQR